MAPSKQLAKLVSDGIDITKLKKFRNLGIAAHVDSGKTTVSERILFYTGRINAIHEVKGKDGVGAVMDHMELEREKGITIQSAATSCQWNDYDFSLIDTPGHIDFTIEVERALRVLDGGILVLCSIGGVQSQSVTVDRQLKRYEVPRVCFINKLDRVGADPWSVLDQVRDKLGLNAVALQVPIGLEDNLQGLVDLIEMKAYKFEGQNGENVTEIPIPDKIKDQVEEKHQEMIEKLADVSEHIEEFYLMEEEPPLEDIKAEIRKATLNHTFTPVLMGSAKANVGVQPLLDSVVEYLPDPTEVDNYALERVQIEKDDKVHEEERQLLTYSNPDAPFLGLAFKLEEGPYGQLTYIRCYQGTLKTGDIIFNGKTKEKVRISRLGRMHSNTMEDIKEIGPGEIGALFGVDCSSGDTFTSDAKLDVGMESIFIPEPVVSTSVRLKNTKKETAFSKALGRFVREDPTFKVFQDPESGETVISGMGELHLEVYVERMLREYGCEVETGKPYVAYRETLGNRVDFEYLHKKQSGGAGQFAGITGYLEPMEYDDSEDLKNEFVNDTVGNNIPPNFMPACEKGFNESFVKGPLIEAPVWGVRAVVTDGRTHPVDSSEMAFKLACQGAFREAFPKGRPSILEPIMRAEVSCPVEYQGPVMGSLTQRRAEITGTSVGHGDYLTVHCNVPLREMFGYVSTLRSLTKGKGEFTQEYLEHRTTPSDVHQEVIQEYKQKKEKDQL